MSAEALAPETTPLEERLTALIQANGPITIADYMADALGHPHDGYYMSQAPIGAAGDFTTAPEISQVFGELIGLWLVQSWTDIGQPKTFNLVELGPGRGVLMADILRAARLRPEFLDAVEISLVETSGRLRHEQQRRLRGGTPPLDWRDRFSEAPEGPLLIIANEMFDCLPIRQFERIETGWRERLVDVNDEGTALTFTLDRTPPPPEISLPNFADVELGAIFEINAAAAALTAEICAALKAYGGRALIIDYGHLASGCGDTLQAVRQHQFWPVLASPGRADITAHVNFEALAKIAFDDGVAVFGPIAQGMFLERLGLSIRTDRLCSGKNASERETIRQGAHRISSPAEMGEIFKVFCLSSPGLAPPPGFEGL